MPIPPAPMRRWMTNRPAIGPLVTVPAVLSASGRQKPRGNAVARLDTNVGRLGHVSGSKLIVPPGQMTVTMRDKAVVVIDFRQGGPLVSALILNPRQVTKGGPARLMEEGTFFQILDRFVDDGCLEFVQGERRVRVGRKDTAPTAVIRIQNPRFFKRVLADGNLGMGEAFMDHDFEMEQGTVSDFLTVLVRNRLAKRLAGGLTIRTAAQLLCSRLANRIRGRRSAIRVHYDYDDDSLFEAFLDPRMIYSCGYVKDSGGTIGELQRDKLQRICEKLRLQPGERLVDLGCGYGGRLIHAAPN